MNNLPPQLWIGSSQALKDHAGRFFRNLLCNGSKAANCYCKNCRGINDRQHPSIMWISPTKSYVVEDLVPIFKKSSFSLDEDEQFFFVIEQSQNLNAACANRLLKILEEPPAGYRFILFSNNENSILPTIKSRCIIQQFSQELIEADQHPILKFFTNKEFSPLEFEDVLKKQGPTENESKELLEQLFCYFAKNYKDKRNIELLKVVMKLPPASGSANMFWKDLYLNFPTRS